MTEATTADGTVSPGSWLSRVPPALLALAVWAVAVAAGLLVRAEEATRALSIDVQVLPMAVGVPLALVAAVLVARGRLSERVAGLLLGALAGWVSFTLLTALAGTPYGIGSVYGDCGRSVAAAEQYRWHLGSTDQFIQGSPAQYPPLWFWLWGRGAALLGREAYQVQGLFQATGLGLVILAAGCAWRLVVSWPRALGAVALTSGLLLVSAGYDPCKGHEISAAMLALPALLFVHQVMVGATAGNRRLVRAALAGVLLAISFLLYQLFVLFSVPGLLVLWFVRAFRSQRLGAVLTHLTVTGITALAAISWYVFPLLPRMLSNPYPRSADPYMVFGTISSVPGLPITLGAAVGAAALTTAAILAWRPKDHFAQALIAVVAGALLVQVAGLLNVARGAESLYSYRTVPWLVVVCGGTVALLGDRPVAALTRALGASTNQAALRRLAATGLALVLLVNGHSAWEKWHPPTVGVESLAASYREDVVDNGHNRSALAYVTPLPTCRRVAGLPATVATTSCFPATAVQKCIRDAFHDGSARPVLVSYDERAGLYFGNHLYLAANAGATGPLDAWQERYRVLQGLAGQKDPQLFLAAAEHTTFGPIQGFVLAATREGHWRWIAQTYHSKVIINFSPSQFTDPAWQICRDHDTVVALQTLIGSTSGRN